MNKKKKQSKFILYIAAVLICAPFIYNIVSSFIKIQRLQNTKAELEQKIIEQKIIELQYTEELDRIGTPKYYEYLARKYFGYIYPDEKVMIEVPETE